MKTEEFGYVNTSIRANVFFTNPWNIPLTNVAMSANGNHLEIQQDTNKLSVFTISY